MLNVTRNGVVSNGRWRSDSVIDLRPSDSTSEQEAHVLAVDDNLVDRKLIEKLLRTSSCRVTAVDSGIRALEYLGLDEDHQSSDDELKVDLIITDYCMPGMTGYELLKRIKKSNFKETPVVIMSSENVLTRIDRCLEEGAEDFILKPVKSSDVKKIKDYLSKEDRSNGRESGINKRKERDGSDLSSDSLPPSTRSPPSDSSLSSEVQSLPSISTDVSPFSSSPCSPSGPLDSPSTPTSPSSPSPPLDSLVMNGSDENDIVKKFDSLD